MVIKKAQTLRIDECLELDPKIDYPFRTSLLKNARCGMCANGNHVPCGRDGSVVIGCKKYLSLHYPLMIKEHDCKYYEYRPHNIYKIPEDKIKIFVGLIDRFEECNECSHNFHGYCDGIEWYPIKMKEGKCEFFRDKTLICKYAIPFFQYGSTMRNNYCTLAPEKRDPKLYPKMTWKVRCPSAQKEYIESYICYIPLKKGLWKNNEQCPECGQKANQEIRAYETGYSYCSEECATKHVNDNAPEGGY